MKDESIRTPALGELVGDVDAFLDHSWQKQWIRFDSQVGSTLLSLGDLDALFASSLLRIPHFRLVMDGRAVPPSSYVRSAGTTSATPETIVETAQIVQMFTEGVADTAKVAEIVASGATLILQGAHRFHPPLADLCSRLTRELGHVCQANAYITPEGERGLTPHSDPHDAFVIQTFGSKCWQVGSDEPAALTLYPGDVLYMPKGTVHSARASDSASGHVTIGVRATTWRDVVVSSLHALIDGALNETELSALTSDWAIRQHEPAPELDHLLKLVRTAVATTDAEAIIELYAADFQSKIRPLPTPFAAAITGNDVAGQAG